MPDPAPQPLPAWKGPEAGKILHGALGFVGGLLIVLIPLIEVNLQSPTPVVVVSAGALPLVLAALEYALSWLRNRDTVKSAAVKP